MVICVSGRYANRHDILEVEVQIEFNDAAIDFVTGLHVFDHTLTGRPL